VIGADGTEEFWVEGQRIKRKRTAKLHKNGKA